MTSAVWTDVSTAVRWRLLSLGFAPPRAEIVEELQALAETLQEDDGEEALDELLQALRDSSTDTLSAEYESLFGGPVRISPYEAGYEPDPVRQGRRLADVAGFYLAFGAEAQGPAGERPDHVGCELEFLAFLELKRLAAHEADDEGAASLMDEVATAFLRDHAGRWLPAFFAEVHETAVDQPVHRALAALGADKLRSELERRAISSVPLRRALGGLSVESDVLACGNEP